MLEGFPFDDVPRPDHGRAMQWLASMHPLTLWIPAVILGFVLGLVFG